MRSCLNLQDSEYVCLLSRLDRVLCPSTGSRHQEHLGREERQPPALACRHKRHISCWVTDEYIIADTGYCGRLNVVLNSYSIQMRPPFCLCHIMTNLELIFRFQNYSYLTYYKDFTDNSRFVIFLTELKQDRKALKGWYGNVIADFSALLSFPSESYQWMEQTTVEKF